MSKNTIFIILIILTFGLSCRLLGPNEYMFEPETLKKAFAAYREKNPEKNNLTEIVVTANSVSFTTGTQKFVYARGRVSEARFESPSEWTKFDLAEVESFDLNKTVANVLEFSKKNSYLTNPSLNKIVINKQKVNRDDNLVSNIDKWRETIRCEINIGDKNINAEYTTNLKGEIVDVAEPNVKPRLKFFDAEQMKKSIAEIKPLFGGKLVISNLSINIENFSFDAPDPQNPNEINTYRFNSHEFLRASSLKSSVPPGFDIDEIDFSLIPKVMQKTLETVKTSNPKVTNISIRIPVDPFKKITEFEWRVQVVGDRSTEETVTFDRQGNLKQG